MKKARFINYKPSSRKYNKLYAAKVAANGLMNISKIIKQAQMFKAGLITKDEVLATLTESTESIANSVKTEIKTNKDAMLAAFQGRFDLIQAEIIQYQPIPKFKSGVFPGGPAVIGHGIGPEVIHRHVGENIPIHVSVDFAEKASLSNIQITEVSLLPDGTHGIGFQIKKPH